MKTLTLDQQKIQNERLLNLRLSDMMTREEVLEFCKRARIAVCCDIVDSDVQDSFIEYYGVLPIWSSNNDLFIMTRVR